MPRFLTLAGFKSKSGESTSLTAKNLKRHNEVLLAQNVNDLEATLALRDEENRAQAAEIEELRQKLAVATVASGADETETPPSNMPVQASKTTQDNTWESSTKKAKSKSKKKSRRSKTRSTSNQHFAKTAIYGPGYLQQYASTSSISISSTATMSDLPGPGRGLGKLYSRAGKILERCINRFAHRCGFGPHAVFERFSATFEISEFFDFPYHDEEIQHKAAILWDSLLEYAQRGTVQTQKTAVRRMWHLAFHPRICTYIRRTTDCSIQRRQTTLRILYRLYSSEAMGTGCIGDSIEVGRLSETICRNVVREHRDPDIVWELDADIGHTIYRIDCEYFKKMSIIDGSRGAEDVLNAVWSNHRRFFRRIIRRFRVYFGRHNTSEDLRDLWKHWLQEYSFESWDSEVDTLPQLQFKAMELYDEVSNERSRTYDRGNPRSVEQDFITDVNPTPSTNS